MSSIKTVIFPAAAAVWGLVVIAFFAFLAFVLYFMVRMLQNRAPRREEEQKVRQSLAQALKSRRTARGLTQEAVAEALGVSRQAVSKWENGSSEPSTANLLALAKLYGVDLEALLEGVEP